MRIREMQRIRSVKKQREFYNKTYNSIEKSNKKISNARLRKGLYKYLFHEFLILLEYSEIQYKDEEK